MVNGQNFSGTGYQLDGTENRDPILGIIVINPNLEAIGESKITSQNYDAEFGQATAGVVSVQTKSGKNQFFGSAFEFFRNNKFQARNPFTQSDPKGVCRKTRRTSSGSRWAVRSCGTGRSSSATTRARAAPKAGRACCRCRRRSRAPATSASTASTSTTRRAAQPRRAHAVCGRVIPQAPGCRHRR